MIWLRQPLLEAIIAHARADAPREACGALFGQGGQVVERTPIANAADDPVRYFRLDEPAFVAAMFAAEKRGLQLIAFYHSHPAGVAVPSQTDIAQSFYPDAVHLIVGLAGDPLVTAWRLSYGAAERVELYVGDAPPPPAAVKGISPRQIRTVAILISAVVAFIVLIVVSLALLPPAPRLP